MRTLYLDLSMGAAGDMLTAALLELLPNKNEFLAKLNHLGLDRIRFELEPSVKCGITGSHMTVYIDDTSEEEHLHHQGHNLSQEHTHEHSGSHSHSHSTLHGIEHIVKDHMNLPTDIVSDILAVYQTIAEAESTVHGVSIDQIHFHEVGTLDAVADVTAVCLLIAELHPDQIIASPIHVGSGTVKCAHGILPVPAPATTHILKGIPIYSGTIQSELCTPTGAALLKHFVTRFDAMPVMSITSIGYGMGRKDFPQANCVRAILGETQDSQDTVTELKCNIDDMTPEELGYVMTALFKAGALDVYTTPIVMKKSRLGTLLSVMCHDCDRDKMIKLIFGHTTTIGIRETKSKRFVLNRHIENLHSSLGDVRVKYSEGYGISRKKYEYDDLSRIASETEMNFNQIAEILDRETNNIKR